MGKKLGRGLEGLFKESEPLKIEDTPIPTAPAPRREVEAPEKKSVPVEPPPPAPAVRTTPPDSVVQSPLPQKPAVAPTSPQAVPLIGASAQPPVDKPIIEAIPDIRTEEAPVTPPPSQITAVTPPASQIPDLRSHIPDSDTINTINTDRLIPNRFQPRKTFAKESLTELIESIRTAGVLQPILVRKSGNYYEIVAGERRWRACQELKLPKVPVIVKEVDDQKMLEWALIENTQREDLNPVERARAYKELMTFFNMTQEEIAKRVGLDRATVTNYIRLLDLPGEIQDELARGNISTTHARSLLSVDEQGLQLKLAKRIRKEGMSVRRLEHIIKWLKRRRTIAQQAVAASSSQQLQIKEIEDRLMRKFNTKTVISTVDNKHGKIIISFYSIDDFQRILDKLDQIN